MPHSSNQNLFSSCDNLIRNFIDMILDWGSPAWRLLLPGWETPGKPAGLPQCCCHANLPGCLGEQGHPTPVPWDRMCLAADILQQWPRQTCCMSGRALWGNQEWVGTAVWGSTLPQKL